MKRRFPNSYGWIRDNPDVRDRYFEPPHMMDIPPVVNLQSDFPPPYSQGKINSCTAQALSAIIEYNERKQASPSRLFIYYNERLLMNTTESDSGASMRTGIKSVSQYGYCREDIWPYTIDKWKTKPNRTAYRFANSNKINNYSRINQNIRQLKLSLASRNPFVFGFTVYEKFESNEIRTSGLLSMPNNEKMLGGHAVIAVGYDDNDQTFMIRNSWGPDWGLNGYFKMPYEYISDPNLAADFWIIN